MSAPGDRLRAEAEAVSRDGMYAIAAALRLKGAASDEYEAVAVADSANGRGPHAAAALRWAAEQYQAVGRPRANLTAVQLRLWASQAEQPPVPTVDYLGPTDDEPPVRAER